MREFSVPAVATIDEATNLTDPVWHNAETAPEAVQFLRRTPSRTGSRWTDVTCAQFRDEVVAVARGLVAAGITPGQRIGLLSHTRYEWTLFDYAIWAAGAVSVPIYETSSPDQIAWMLGDSGAVACLVETNAHALAVAGIRDRLPALEQVWQIEAGDLDRLHAQGEAVAPREIEARRKTAKASDIATIIYTSGTTGRPKGCVLTHRNLYTDIANAIPALPNLFNPGASTLLFLPLAHAFARMIQLGVVQARATMAHTSDLHHLMDELRRVRPTYLLTVPRVLEKLHSSAAQKAKAEGKGRIFQAAERTAIAYSKALDTRSAPGLGLRIRHRLFDLLVYRKLRATLGGRCTALISGGAPLGDRLGHFFRGVGLTVQEGYGLTETSPAISVNRHDTIRIGTVGQPLPGVSVRIADDGEILVRGDLVFRGYWNDPDATAEVFDDDGWFRSGDLGALDDDGYLTITGRKKEIIVTAAGKNVAPAVLEDLIRTHPLISQAVVVGDQRPFVAALITIDEETFPAWRAEHGYPETTTVADLRDDPGLRTEIQRAVDDANRAVSHAEAVKVFRILPHDFSESTGELTPTLKVKRSVVHRTWAPEIAKIYGG